jgi:hypothetical protein
MRSKPKVIAEVQRLAASARASPRRGQCVPMAPAGELVVLTGGYFVSVSGGGWL